MITLKNHYIATRVSSPVNEAVRRLARALGISRSEYLRSLILQDLNSKGLFSNEQMINALKQSEENRKQSTRRKSMTDILREL